MTLQIHGKCGERVRAWCVECAAKHEICPKASKRKRKTTPGREFVRAFRKQYEDLNGPVRWKVAL